MLLFLWVLTACGTTEPENLPVYQSIEDLSDKKVGAPSGGFQEVYLEKEYPEMEVLRIDTDADLIQALLTKRCDAIVMNSLAISISRRFISSRYARYCSRMAVMDTSWISILFLLSSKKITSRGPSKSSISSLLV